MRISDWSSDVCSSDLPDTDNGHSRQSGNPGAGPSRAGYPLGGDDEVKEWSIFMKVLITEYLRINLDTEKWECRRRSEERRVGQECVSTCRSRGSPSHKQKKL